MACSVFRSFSISAIRGVCSGSIMSTFIQISSFYLSSLAPLFLLSIPANSQDAADGRRCDAIAFGDRDVVLDALADSVTADNQDIGSAQQVERHILAIFMLL